MTDETQDARTAPGSGAGDAAPTQAIPRIPKPAKKPAAKKSPAKKSTSTSGTTSRAETDKGRVRETPPPKPDEPKDTDKKRMIQPVGGPPGRPLTAADYAKTTNPSPSTTSVMPAVKDKKSPGPKAPKVTMAPSQDPGSGRRASLRLVHVEPWSVTRLAFAISVAMMIVAVVAVTIFWVVLDAAGVWGQVNDSVTTVLSDDSSGFDITDYLGFGRMVGLTLVLSAINVILMTALATIAAHLYNLAAQLLGGVEVTFSEDK